MSLSHSAARLAYSAAIDSALKYIGKDRDKNLIKLVDLTENEIIRDAGYMRFIPATAELNIKDVG